VCASVGYLFVVCCSGVVHCDRRCVVARIKIDVTSSMLAPRLRPIVAVTSHTRNVAARLCFRRGETLRRSSHPRRGSRDMTECTR
jgi:hypothetical protein